MLQPVSSREDTHTVFVKAPRDAAKGGDVEKAAARLAANLARSSEFRFFGLEPCKPSLRESFREFLRLRDDVAKAQSVWLHDCGHIMAVRLFYLARKAKKPVLITQHDDVRFHRNALYRLALLIIDKFITRRMLRLADQVTFSSDAVAENYYHKIAFTKPVQIIPNGVDLATFQPPAPDMRQILRNRFALKDDQPVAIFAGSFTRDENMPVIHTLAELLPDWRFWLIGDGSFNPDKWFLPNVQAFRKRSPAGQAELYQTADLMIAPNANTHFPTGFQEALACGLPVLCSPMTAEGSHFAKGHIETIEVDPRSPDDTALLWADTLRAKRPDFPRRTCKGELSNIAQLFWDETKITSYYAEVLRRLGKD